MFNIFRRLVLEYENIETCVCGEYLLSKSNIYHYKYNINATTAIAKLTEADHTKFDTSRFPR